MCYHKLPFVHLLPLLGDLEEVHAVGKFACVNQLLSFVHFTQVAHFYLPAQVAGFKTNVANLSGVVWWIHAEKVVKI